MKVIIRDEVGHVRTYDFSNTGEMIIGRDSNCAIFIHNPLISRRHAKLRWKNDLILIEDLGSHNGTFLNGQKLMPNEFYAIPPGGEIKLGSDIFLNILGEPKIKEPLVKPDAKSSPEQSDSDRMYILKHNIEKLSAALSFGTLGFSVRDGLIDLKFKTDLQGRILDFNQKNLKSDECKGGVIFEKDNRIIKVETLFLADSAQEITKKNLLIAFKAYNEEFANTLDEGDKLLVDKNLVLMNSTKKKGMKYFLRKLSANNRSAFFVFNSNSGEILGFVEDVNIKSGEYGGVAVARGLFTFDSDLKIIFKRYFGNYVKRATLVLRNSAVAFSSQPVKQRKKRGRFW